MITEILYYIKQVEKGERERGRESHGGTNWPGFHLRVRGLPDPEVSKLADRTEGEVTAAQPKTFSPDQSVSQSVSR